MFSNSDIRKKYLESFNVCLVFPGNRFCIHQPNLAFLSFVPIFNHTQDYIQAFVRIKNKFIDNSNMGKDLSESFKLCFAFPEKSFCIRQSSLVFQSLLPMFNH